jgi:hypothetical protein
MRRSASTAGSTASPTAASAAPVARGNLAQAVISAGGSSGGGSVPGRSPRPAPGAPSFSPTAGAAAGGGVPALSAADAAAAAAAAPYAMDDLLTPMERSVKEYLTSAVAADLIACLSLLAVERPPDPHLWLAQKILARGPAGNMYMVVKRSVDLGGGGGGGAGEGAVGGGEPRSKMELARALVDTGTTLRPAFTPVPEPGNSRTG